MLTFDFRKINLQPGAKVLDVGCGEGRHIFGILNEFKNVHCFGLDQDLPSLEKCKEGLEFFKELDTNETIFQQGSVYQLPFEDNFFDLIICSEVLEHLEDYHAALKEIYRVLKPAGNFLSSYSQLGGSHRQPHLYHLYSKLLLLYHFEETKRILFLS